MQPPEKPFSAFTSASPSSAGEPDMPRSLDEGRHVLGAKVNSPAQLEVPLLVNAKLMNSLLGELTMFLNGVYI